MSKNKPNNKPDVWLTQVKLTNQNKSCVVFVEQNFAQKGLRVISADNLRWEVAEVYSTIKNPAWSLKLTKEQ